MELENRSNVLEKLKYISMMATIYFASSFALAQLVETNFPAFDDEKPRGMILLEVLAEVVCVAVGIHFIQTTVVPRVIGNRQIKPSWLIAASAGLALGLRLTEFGKKYGHISDSFAKQGLF